MIAVLLCTYNGAQYLSQQLDSLMSQSYKDFRVYIYDDGSRDDTLKVIQKYVQDNPDFFTWVSDTVEHRGAARSFMWLLEKIQADYYMFCDQDDFWLPEKIEHTYNKMKEMESMYPNTPLLVHTDLHICDSNLDIINPSFWKYRHLLVDVSKDFRYLCFGNIVTGCTMMINKRSKEVSLPYVDDYYLHDYWIALMTAKNGRVDNLKEQTILYRQHGNNAAGIGKKFKWGIHMSSIIHWWKEERPIIKKLDYGSDVKLLYYRLLYFFKRYIHE